MNLVAAGGDADAFIYSVPNLSSPRPSATTDSDLDSDANHDPPLLPPTHKLSGMASTTLSIDFGPRSILGITNASVVAVGQIYGVGLWRIDDPTDETSAAASSLPRRAARCEQDDDDLHDNVPAPRSYYPVATFSNGGSTNDMSFSNDGRIAFGSVEFGGFGTNNTISVWSAETTQRIGLLPRHTPLRRCVFTQDGRLLVCGMCDGHIDAWDMRAPADSNVVVSVKLERDILTVALSSDDMTIAAAVDPPSGGSPMVRIFSLFAPSSSFCVFSPYHTPRHGMGRGGIRFSRDGNGLLSTTSSPYGFGEAAIWSLKETLADGSGSWRATPQPLTTIQDRGITSAAFLSEQEEEVLVAMRDGIKVFGRAGGEPLLNLKCPFEHGVSALATQSIC